LNCSNGDDSLPDHSYASRVAQGKELPERLVVLTKSREEYAPRRPYRKPCRLSEEDSPKIGNEDREKGGETDGGFP